MSLTFIISRSANSGTSFFDLVPVMSSCSILSRMNFGTGWGTTWNEAKLYFGLSGLEGSLIDLNLTTCDYEPAISLLVRL
jgi:hypothetical protein